MPDRTNVGPYEEEEAPEEQPAQRPSAAPRSPYSRPAPSPNSVRPAGSAPPPRGASGANPVPRNPSGNPAPRPSAGPGPAPRPGAPAGQNRRPRFWPEQPRSLTDLGLSITMIEELILKAVFFAGEMRGHEIADKIKVPTAVVDEAIEGLRKQKYLDLKGGGGMGVGKSTMIYQVTTFANDLLKQILERNKYNGPAPIPLEQYIKAVKAQTVRGNKITKQKMADKFGDLIIRDYIFDGIGPAMNSGRAIFFYGPPGNGKTAICQCMTDCFEGDIFIPHAILVDDFVIRIYDETIHKPLQDDETTPTYDHRWVRCRRPLIVVGGELTLEMLDLVYSPEVKFYEGPFQLKATNGMLLVDDFGRQKVAPKDLLNRWIVPLESDVDYLTMHTGKKLQMPFDVFVAFSTNLDPSDLVDDAFLRRVRYKLEVQRPDEDHFHQIFEMMCNKRGVPYDPDLVQYLIDTHYKPFHRPFAACQPRDLLDQVIDMSNYRGIPPQLHPQLLDAAVKSYFVKFDKPRPD